MTRKTAVPGSVSWGTMRPQDLIPRFLGELGDLDEDRYAEYLAQIPEDAWDDEEHPWWTSEDASSMVDELFDVLDEYAPEGYYFGSHPGDGCDYGYWPEDEEEGEEEE